MADEFEEVASGAGKMPSWIWLAVGGGVLLLLLMKGGNKQTTMETSNLLAAEVDANLKAMQENLDLQLKTYREDQSEAWAEFRQSIEELVKERQGVEPPGETPPYDREKPKAWLEPWFGAPYYGDYNWWAREHGQPTYPIYIPPKPPPSKGVPMASGQGAWEGAGNAMEGYIPDAVAGSIRDHEIMGFNYKLGK